MMTIEEVNEKFKDVLVTFSSYYKYSFTYTGESEDGYKLRCSYGGSSDDIYRYDVDTKPFPFVHTDNWTSVTITDPNGVDVFDEYYW